MTRSARNFATPCTASAVYIINGKSINLDVVFCASRRIRIRRSMESRGVPRMGVLSGVTTRFVQNGVG